MNVTTRVSSKALVSLLLGLSSVSLITGVPAVLMGLAGIREINQSDGRLAGRGMAIAGMLLGAFATVVLVVCILAMILVHMRETANRLYCENNLKHVGHGINVYHEAHNEFPSGTIIPSELPPEKR